MEVKKDINEIKRILKFYSIEDIIPEKYLKKLSIHYFKKGEIIYLSQNKMDYLYFFVKGRVKVYPLLENGKEIIIDFAEPLDIFGDVEYILGDKIYSNIEAINDCALIAIYSKDLKEILKGNDKFYALILKLLTKKLINNSVKLIDIQHKPPRERAMEFFRKVALDNKIENIKYIEMAKYLLVSDRHLRKVIRELEENGLIKKVGSTIYLK